MPYYQRSIFRNGSSFKTVAMHGRNEIVRPTLALHNCEMAKLACKCAIMIASNRDESGLLLSSVSVLSIHARSSDRVEAHAQDRLKKLPATAVEH